MAVAILMLFQSVAHMFNVWDALKDYPKCIQDAVDPTLEISQAQVKYSQCTENLYRITGIQVRYKQTDLSMRQYWGALIAPVVSIFIWAIVFFFGIIFYNTGKIIIPIENVQKKFDARKPESLKKKKPEAK
ncbi:MAG: hypothetical protein QXK06_02255 [Candidatus Diapherotrites archaeon]